MNETRGKPRGEAPPASDAPAAAVVRADERVTVQRPYSSSRRSQTSLIVG